jgi:hypothetical protein
MLSVFKRYTRTVHLATDLRLLTLCGKVCLSSDWMILTDAPANCAPCKRALGEGEHR